MKSIIASISCLEFVNKINSLFNDLLYSSNEGYMYTKAKQAIDLKDKILELFSFEADKIIQQTGFCDDNNIVAKKKKELVEIIDKHYCSQIPIWAQEVFQELVDNYLFQLSLNKTKFQEIYRLIENAILWLANIKKMKIDDIEDIKKEYKVKLNQILKSNDSDFIPNITQKTTDISLFMKFWNLILNNHIAFLNYNLENDIEKLSDDDYKYFVYLKNKLNTYKKDDTLDEILLINTAANKVIFDDTQKYEFIKAINNDFLCHLERNKVILENDKINIIKRRIKLFEDKNKNISSYYDKLICCSLESR